MKELIIYKIPVHNNATYICFTHSTGSFHIKANGDVLNMPVDFYWKFAKPVQIIYRDEQ